MSKIYSHLQLITFQNLKVSFSVHVYVCMCLFTSVYVTIRAVSLVTPKVYPKQYSYEKGVGLTRFECIHKTLNVPAPFRRSSCAMSSCP